MNRTKIEWCDYTWNPVVGCKHGCSYCYARRFAERGLGEYGRWDKGRRFNPRFLPERLNEPGQVQKPSKIFTVSMGDLFGDWVPAKWIWEVLKIADECSHHTFLFLTKNPQRYLEYSGVELGAWPYKQERIDFPRNCWAGLSVTDFQSWTWANCRLDHILAPVRFLSIEPLSGEVARLISANGLPPGADWVIIGAQTGPGAKPPNPDWVQAILDKTRERNVPVFLKDNLNWPDKVQEFPAMSGDFSG